MEATRWQGAVQAFFCYTPDAPLRGAGAVRDNMI
jgi:hypothetical protein